MSHEAAAPVGLSQISTPDLEALSSALQARRLPDPPNESALQAHGLGHLAPKLQPYLALGRDALVAIATTALAERHHRQIPKLTLVWTGDDPGVGHTRYTKVVLPELFSQARRHVLVAGYSFDRGQELFGPLHQAMTQHGVTADFFVDIQQLIERLESAAKAAKQDWRLLASPLHATRSPDARGHCAVALFYDLMWPFGAPRPRIYFDPRTASEFNAASLHAKCVVIDRHTSLITSANFTNRGQNRNFEVGVQIDDHTFATALSRQWANLREAGVVIEGRGDADESWDSPDSS